METQQDRPQPTQPSQWRGRGGMPLTLPSGNVALVRVPGIQHFLKAGIIPNNLRTLIMKGMAGETEFKLEDMVKNEEDLDRLLETFDKVLLEVVVEPKVAPVVLDEEGKPVPFEDRDQSLIYVDEVVLEDKMFIFQFAVGGTRDLENFRDEQKAVLESIRPGAPVPLPTQPTDSD